MRTELGLAWAGLRHRPGPAWLLALGVALATMMPVLASGLQASASVAAVTDAVAAVPEGSRGVLAVTSRDLRGTDLDGLDAQVSAGLVDAGLPAPARLLAFRSLALNGSDVTVAADDRVADDVSLTDGRLPASCTPTACEVLAVSTSDGSGAPPTASQARSLGLVVTGTAQLRQPRLTGLGLVTAGQPLLLGDDPAAMADLTVLTSYGRTLAWLSDLDPHVIADRAISDRAVSDRAVSDRATPDRAVPGRGAAAFAAELARIADQANLTAGPLSVTWPNDVVIAAAARADRARPRFAVLGAGTGALQLGFCLVLAAGRRRAERRRATLLTTRGARPGQVLQVALWPALAAAAAGLVAGATTGALVVAALTARVTARPWALAADALADSWPTLLVLGVAAVLVAVATRLVGEITARTLRLLLGLALVGAGGLAVLALVRPDPDPAAPLPVAALVALVFATGVLATLAWSPLSSTRPGRPRPGLVAVVRLARRRPLVPSVTAGFLAAALATSSVAAIYAATLERSATDRAAAVVPLDVRLTPSTQVTLPGTVIDADALQRAAPGTVLSGVVSTPVTSFAGSSLATTLPLTGVDPDVIPRLSEFAAVTGSQLSAARLADRLRVTPAAVVDPVVPAGVRELRLAVTGLRGDADLTLWTAGPNGQEQSTPLVRSGDAVVATLKPGPARTVRALEVTESPAHLTGRQHQIGEGRTDRPLVTGTLRFGAVAADGTALPWSWSGWGGDQPRVAAGQSSLSVAFRLANDRVVVVPGWTAPATRAPLPVVVDPATAARAGSRGAFGIALNGTTQPVTIVAVLPRMPTLPAAFVLADRAAVTALADRTAPGAAPVLQVWIAAPPGSLSAVRATLDTSLARTATVQYRADLAAGYAADPVNGGFVTLLGVAGAVALLLSLVALAGGVRADRAASAADLYALELDGVPARRLRTVLTARGGLVLAVAVPVGLLGGLGVAAAAVRLLGTGPDGRAVVPPLHLVLASGPTASVVLAALLGPAAAVGLTALASLRTTRLQAPETDLR